MKAAKKAPAPNAATKELEGEAAAGSFMQHSHKHRAKDINEREMDEEVHDFAEDNVKGISGIRQETHPYGDNGQLNMYAQHKHKKHSKGDNHHPFIGERKYDEDVQGFVVDAINNPLGVERNDEPYPTNGYKNVYPDVDHSQSGTSFAAEDFGGFDYSEAASGFLGQRKHRKHHRDIAERKMDTEVHGFVVSALPPLKERVRNEVPYQANGW